MFTGNVLQLSGASQSAELVLDNAPEGAFDGYKLNISMTVTVTGTPTPATADLKNFLTRAIGQVYEEYGPKGARKLGLNAVDGLDLRTLHRLTERNEVQSNFLGVAQTAGDKTFTANVTRRFAVPWLRGMRKRPGHTQMRTFKIKAFEGAAGTWDAGTYVRKPGTFITIEIEFMNRPGRDRVVPILAVSRENSPRRDLVGPDGLTLAAWVPGTAAAASPLTAFTLDVGKRRIHQLQSVASVTRQMLDEQLDQGASPTTITDEHTVIYCASDNDELEALPHGAIKFEEAKSDLSPIDMRVLHYPVLSELEAKRYAVHAAAKIGRPVLLTQDEPGIDQDNGAAAVAPAEIVTPDDSRFALVPGVVGAPGSEAAGVSIPAHYLAAAKGAKSAAGGGALGAEAVRRLEKIASMRVPGATASSGVGEGSIREEIRAKYAAVA